MIVATLIIAARGCVPSLPPDIEARRAFTPSARSTPAVNSTLYWSATLQRTRLDILDADTGTLRSTVTDPSGSGMAHSAVLESNGTCHCMTFAFTDTILPYTYTGHRIVNCTKMRNTIIGGVPVRHWSVDSSRTASKVYESMAMRRLMRK